MAFVFGLPVQVAAFLVTVAGSAAAYLAGRRFGLTFSDRARPAVLRPGDMTFLVGTTLAVLLGMELNGRFVITQGILRGLSFIWPVAKYVALALAIYYIYARFIRGPRVKVVDEGDGSGGQ